MMKSEFDRQVALCQEKYTSATDVNKCIDDILKQSESASKAEARAKTISALGSTTAQLANSQVASSLASDVGGLPSKLVEKVGDMAILGVVAVVGIVAIVFITQDKK